MANYSHSDGPGLKVLSNNQWYGGGYCGVCGDRGENLVPLAVRYWDCDDGWRMGVLCVDCGQDCAERGPREGDYAMDVQDDEPIAKDDMIDVLASDDLDAAYSQTSMPDYN